ncbi:hypothetical protein AB0M32_42405 [Streptomyces sp. NPDC051985]|uniref:hypothetical protein n=1 Tax=Streptomyces sp. NPDC051985 TaxID=3155807 RepID=UPI0034368D49
MRSHTDRQLAVVIDPDAARLAALESAFGAVPGTEVFFVDAPEGRAVISSVGRIIDHPGSAPRAVILVRAQPGSWATAAMLAALRRHGEHASIVVVITAEGGPETLPVLIADFPAIRMVSPDDDPREVVAAVTECRSANRLRA